MERSCSFHRARGVSPGRGRCSCFLQMPVRTQAVPRHWERQSRLRPTRALLGIETSNSAQSVAAFAQRPLLQMWLRTQERPDAVGKDNHDFVQRACFSVFERSNSAESVRSAANSRRSAVPQRPDPTCNQSMTRSAALHRTMRGNLAESIECRNLNFFTTS